jgi:hypothetical protein
VVIGGAVLLLFCAVGGCCLWAVLGVRSSAVTGSADAEPYRGRPIGECYDAAFERMLACSDITCRFPGQMMFTQCTHIAEAQPGFCEEHTGPAHCSARCAGDPNPMSCNMVCGQLSVPVGEYCGTR